MENLSVNGAMRMACQISRSLACDLDELVERGPRERQVSLLRIQMRARRWYLVGKPLPRARMAGCDLRDARPIALPHRQV
jgi:hypothetical protein